MLLSAVNYGPIPNSKNDQPKELDEVHAALKACRTHSIGIERCSDLPIGGTTESGAKENSNLENEENVQNDDEASHFKLM